MEPQYNYTNYNQVGVDRIKKLRIGIIIVLIAIALLSVVLWVAGRGYAQIDPNITDQEITYTLSSNDGSESEYVSTGTFKELLPAGRYEYTARVGSSSSFGFIDVKGFFRTSAVVTELESEWNRTFVGDNPSPCMLYTNVLMSYSCGSRVASLQTHQPPSDMLPSLTEPFSPDNTALIEGTINLNGTQYIIVRDLLSPESGTNQHIAYPLSGGSTFDTANAIPLAGLDGSILYEFTAYNSGFIAFSPRAEVPLYFSSLAESPTSLFDALPSDKSATSLLVSGDTIALTYADASAVADIDIHGEEENDVPVSVLVRSSESTTPVDLENYYSRVQPCGEQLLCAINGTVADVYSYSDDGVELSYTIRDVIDIRAAGSNMLVIKTDTIVLLDPASETGSVVYSYGVYQNCGYSVSDNGLVLCILRGDTKRAILLEPSNGEPVSLIDQQISELYDDPNISSLSVYKSLITIGQQTGEYAYSDELAIYTYDEDELADTTRRITEKIEEIGIGQNQYTIRYIY